MKNLLSWRPFVVLKTFVVAHKIVTVIVILVVAAAGYKVYTSLTSTSGETQYVTASVARDTVVVSVTGSGQVSASNQVDVKSKVSGTVTVVSAVQGQSLKAGTLIAQMDARQAQKSVRDARASLETAQLSLEKLTQSASELSLLQAENTLAQAKQSQQNAQSDLVKSYDDGYNAVSNAFSGLPTVMAGLVDMFFNSTIDRTVWNVDWYANISVSWDLDALQYKNDFLSKYQSARKTYDALFERYKSIGRNADTATIESLIYDTYETTVAISDTVKAANNYLDFVQDLMKQHNVTSPSAMSTHQSSLDSFTSTVNSHLSALYSASQSIEDFKQAIVNAGRSVAEKTASLADLKAGADPLDVKSQELAITQRRNALLDAQEALADYYIRAPFDGVIATVDVQKGDSVSGGTIATFITKQQLAEVSLNEVDVAKVKVGQRATLTFDAVPDLSITGTVASVDTVGTVTQGVVNYTVKVGFDTQDERIKPGMSVSAAIVTDVVQNVLVVPNSAVKSRNGTFYVEVFDDGVAVATSGQEFPSLVPPREQTVEIGLANDTVTEIISGLSEGDKVVVRTVSPTSQQTPTAASSLFGGGRSAIGR